MDFHAAADYLRIRPVTLERWVRQGLMADAGLQGRRFDPEQLARWARRQGVLVRAAREHRPEQPEDLLADAVLRGAVTLHEGAIDAAGAIEIAVRALGLPSAAEARLLDATLERERLAATALGGGVALPHPRHPSVEFVERAALSVVHSDPPTDWAAHDRVPVHSVLLVVAPDTSVHLSILSRIATLLRDARLHELLVERPTQDELVALLRSLPRDDAVG